MGLDMYLSGKRFISSFKDSDKAIAEAIANNFPEIENKRTSYDTPCVREVTIEAGYWRKANAIHKWFVDNVQGGEDECRPHYVTREQLEKLREICERVLAFRHLAVELLPTGSGFFFGSTTYDEWYFKDLETTIKIIDDCLELPVEWEFEYQSSW